VQVTRVLAFVVALAGCEPRTIELGRADATLTIDAPPDVAPLGCRCRLPCPAATATPCGSSIPGSTCGVDGFCIGSVGVCTSTSPLPCGGLQSSVCRASDISTLPCPL
jgi:hypothetical protein